MLAADTETCLIRPGLKAPPLVCVSWSRSETDSGLVSWKDAEGFCERMLQEPSVWGNAPYDLGVIGNQFPRLIVPVFDALANDLIHDILIRQKLLDIAHGRQFGQVLGKVVKYTYSVDAVSRRHLGVQMEKEKWRLRYAEFRDLPIEQWPEGARQYALTDAVSTLKIFNAQKAEDEQDSGEASFLENEFAQVRAHMMLHLISAWGIKTDYEAIKKLDEYLKKEWEECRDRLIGHGLVRKVGSRNTKAAKALMMECVDRQNLKLTETGIKKVKTNVLTRDQAIDKGYVALDGDACLASQNEVLKDYADFGHLLKMRGTYVDYFWNGVKVPIQTRFDPLLETGRTSSADPNIQQLPRETGFREVFIPRPGCVFVACDYDKAELVSLGQVCIKVCGFSRLAERLNAGFDPHLDMGAQILGISYDEAAARLAAGDKEVKRMRQMAKAANFGLPGGLGVDTFIEYARGGYGVFLTREQAVDLKNKWFQTWPEMRLYFDWIRSLMDGNNRAWIRQLVSNRARGNIAYTVCANTFFQGLTADAAKAAGWEITRRQFTEPKSLLYSTHLVNFVHDEYVLEVREEIAHEAAMELQKVMVDEYNVFTPDVPVQATPAMMRRWSKNAEPRWRDGGKKRASANDRLIPWEDYKVAA